jgi:hypothetical protein
VGQAVRLELSSAKGFCRPVHVVQPSPKFPPPSINSPPSLKNLEPFFKKVTKLRPSPSFYGHHLLSIFILLIIDTRIFYSSQRRFGGGCPFSVSTFNTLPFSQSPFGIKRPTFQLTTFVFGQQLRHGRSFNFTHGINTSIEWYTPSIMTLTSQTNPSRRQLLLSSMVIILIFHLLNNVN